MRARTALGAVAVLALLGGCGQAERPGERIHGHVLTVYFSGPSRGASSLGAAAALNGARLALAQDSFASALPSTAQRNLYVSSPGFTPSGLTAEGRRFVSEFTSAYGHAPSPQAIFGYAAMAAVIHVLQTAGDSANSRSTVVHDFFAIRNLNSVLGTFSIDKNGDTSLTAFVISRVKGGRLVPETEVQGQG